MRYAKKPLSKTAVVFVFSQFPMGKVKPKLLFFFSFLSRNVSIPYGKGKVAISMGRASLLCGINSLWER